MPKINVYLPEELAQAVKEAGLPVSAVCQRALEQAVRHVTAIQQTALGELMPDEVDKRLGQFTAGARAVVVAAIGQAEAAEARCVGTKHLLVSLVGGEENVARQVLRTIAIDPAEVGELVARQADHEAQQADGTGTPHFSAAAADAMTQAVTQATTLGHSAVSCEHLLLGLIAEPDGAAGRVLRTLGADSRLTRHVVTTLLAGYGHLAARSAKTTVVDAMQQQLEPLIARVERLERRLDSVPERP
jgi:ATP-dependent Clp protease ATP-binding subunit ClpA